MKTAITPELYCSNIKTSLSFYVGILGFDIQYQREEDGFVMLERHGARIMLEEVRASNRMWLMGQLEYPFGRGVNFEIKTEKIDELYEKIQSADVRIFLPLEEKEYKVNDSKIINLQFIVPDPDGYLLRFSQTIHNQ